ncbi:unnamed protein product [Tenebrio molitor]|nr:unnamed protein product [Tenebrio molitor]
MKHVSKWLFFCTRHVGPLCKKGIHFATRCINSYFKF